MALQESSRGVGPHSQEGDVCKYLKPRYLFLLRLERDLISGHYGFKHHPLTIFSILFSTSTICTVIRR